jgi:hypothetical protein
MRVATFLPGSVPSGVAWSSLELFCLNFISPKCITVAVTYVRFEKYQMLLQKQTFGFSTATTSNELTSRARYLQFDQVGFKPRIQI